MRKIKIFLYSLLSILLITVVIIYFCNKAVTQSAVGKLYTNKDSIPFNKAGLLLGTTKFLANGYINQYYMYRIEAAVNLIRAGKIKYIIVSGDNGREEYNEPALMRSDLMAAGVDSSKIFLDYAGFRTFDSMVRLKEVFRQSSVTVISQPFHIERALYIASREGIVAIGFNARDVSKAAGFKVQAREKLARVKLFLDYLLNKQPKFLGRKIDLP